MAHAIKPLKLSNYFREDYPTTFYDKLLDEITKENKIMFMSRANLVGEVFYTLNNKHIGDVCNITIQDLVDYYSTEEVIDYYAWTKFRSIEGSIPHIIEVQKLIHTRNKLTDRANAFNSLVFMRKETDFFKNLMKLLDKYTPEDKSRDICGALDNYFRSIHKHVPNPLKEGFYYHPALDTYNNPLMITALDFNTRQVEVHPFDEKILDYYDAHPNCQYMIHLKSDLLWKH